MKKLTYVVLVISFLTLAFALLGVFFASKTLDERVFYTEVKVVDSKVIGFDIDDSNELKFGNLAKSTKETRNLIFENNYGFPVLLKTQVEGDIASLLDFEETVFVEADERKELGITADILPDTDYGTYDGIIKVIVKPSP